MRILSWNTNSWKKIRNYQPWFSLDTWSAILGHLEADVVCLQETKLTRKQAVQDRLMCLPDDSVWESFWDFHPSKGYSGTVTYVNKQTVGLPCKAEYGLTGRKAQNPTVTVPGASSNTSAPSIPSSNNAKEATEGIGAHPIDCKYDLDDDLYFSLDEEGRCVVVDFGFFVLLNLYCPVMSSSESPRYDFRNAFHQCLNERARKLILQGREVIIVGDINIARQPIDHCDYSQSHSNRTTEEDKETERQEFYAESRARTWFDTFLKPKGPFHDVQREIFPDRVGMYTCWNTKINARPANYGTRIDYTLVSPGLREWVKSADIQNTVPGSDHCPVYVDFYDEREINGKVVKFKELLSNASQSPPLAASRWEEFNTKSLKSFFSKSAASTSEIGSGPESRIWQPPPRPNAAPSSSATPKPTPTLSEAKTPSKTTLQGSQTQKRKSSSVDSNAGNTKKKQLKLGSFFASPSAKNGNSSSDIEKAQPPSSSSPAAEVPTPASNDRPSSSSTVTTTSPVKSSHVDEDTDNDSIEDSESVDWSYLQSLPDPDFPRSSSNPSTTAAWSNLFKPLPPPLCTLHSEPCKSYTVNKRDAKNNYGRKFWLCSRNVGPNYEKGFGGWEGKGWGSKQNSAGGVFQSNSHPVPPATNEKDDGGDPRQYRCGFFIWHSDWEKEWKRNESRKTVARK
ncbi:unnamed protein product [Sympodiomycopsis kandeliae]